MMPPRSAAVDLSLFEKGLEMSQVPRMKSLNLLAAIQALLEIHLLVASGQTAAFDEFPDIPDNGNMEWFLELAIADLVQQLSVVDVVRWKRASMITSLTEKQQNIEAVLDPAILRKFPDIFSEINRLNQKFAALD